MRFARYRWWQPPDDPLKLNSSQVWPAAGQGCATKAALSSAALLCHTTARGRCIDHALHGGVPEKAPASEGQLSGNVTHASVPPGVEGEPSGGEPEVVGTERRSHAGDAKIDFRRPPVTELTPNSRDHRPHARYDQRLWQWPGVQWSTYARFATRSRAHACVEWHYSEWPSSAGPRCFRRPEQNHPPKWRLCVCVCAKSSERSAARREMDQGWPLRSLPATVIGTETTESKSCHLSTNGPST